MFGKPAFALSCHSLSVRERGRVIPPNQHINHNRQQIKHRHPRKHRLIPKRGNQSPCNRAANADADIIRAEEGGVCTARAFRVVQSPPPWTAMQAPVRRSQSRKALPPTDTSPYSETAPKQKRRKHRNITAIGKNPLAMAVCHLPCRHSHNQHRHCHNHKE